MRLLQHLVHVLTDGTAKATLSARPSLPLAQQWLLPLPAFPPQFLSPSRTACILFTLFAVFLPHWGI